MHKDTIIQYYFSYMRKGFAFVPILIIIVLLGTVGAGAYYLGSINKNQLQKDLSIINTPMPSSTEKTESLFSGNLKRLNDDLDLFNQSEFEKSGEETVSSVYYSAGVFLKGEYQGYTRIIAIRGAFGPGGPQTYVFATKDFNSFILDGDPQTAIKYPETDWRNPFNTIKKSKISKITSIESDSPPSIKINDKFGLYKINYQTISEKTGKKDKNNYDTYEDILNTDFTKYEKINSPSNNLAFYVVPYSKNTTIDQMPAEYQQEEKTKNKYIKSNTEIIAVDKIGVPVVYNLALNSTITSYPQQKLINDQQQEEFDAKVKAYEEEVKKNPDYPYPKPPDMLRSPGLGITTANNSGKYYQKYDVAIPGGCGPGSSTYIMQNITDQELDSAFVLDGIEYFTQKTSDNPINKISYNAKTSYLDDKSFMELNNSSKPTYEDYVKRNPILYFKDPWNRLVAIGEYDYKIMGGCGKPVIYLYPEKPTQVSLSFLTPIKFDISIPNYINSWKIQADPTGVLHDLQPEYTTCRLIDISKFGSEYAKNACEKNKYPYIYWAGQNIEKTYPKIENGWVVAQKNLKVFFQEKLTQIGLIQKEQNDFIEYWLPTLQKKNSPFYHISFLQTYELNKLFPMNIQPSPQSVIRVFMDYYLLDQIPTVLPTPQQLKHIDRNGFTMVEWGGIKK